jgi:hypothetical protein
MTWQEGSHMQHPSGYLRSRREPLDQVTSTESLVEAPLFAEASFLTEALLLAEAVMVASNADPDDGYSAAYWLMLTERDPIPKRHSLAGVEFTSSTR